MGDDFSALSIGKSRIVCGKEIKKLPIGAYLKAIAKIAELPDALFDNKSFAEALDELAKARGNNVRIILGKLLDTVPLACLKFIGELIDVDAEELLNNEIIGLDGLVEMLFVFAEVNGLKKCLSLWSRWSAM